MAMGAFERELMKRSPLAVCVLEVSDYVFDGGLLESGWESNRGRCYEDTLRFSTFVALIRDALILYDGSGRQSFQRADQEGTLPTCQEAAYRRRFPLASYGFFVFLLLMAPTSSILPIKDPIAERRLYFSMLGLLLIVVDLLARVKIERRALAIEFGEIAVHSAAQR